MSDYITSLIRTYSPIAVGVLVSWLASFGVVISGSSEAALSAGIAAVAAGLYYAALRMLETRIPWLGLLLGAAKSPTYPTVSPLAAYRARRRQAGALKESNHAA